MEFSPIFLKARTLGFACITFVALLWIILLCVEIFFEWDVSDRSERSLITVIVLVNMITLIMLPILIIRPFRAWLDGARLMFLLVAHIGVASAFTYWYSKFKCPDQTPDAEGTCQLLNLYILLGNWVIPILLVIYAFGLSIMLYSRRSRQVLDMTPSDAESQHDEQKVSLRNSFMPTPQISVAQSPFSLISFPPDALKRTSERVSSIPISERGLLLNTGGEISRLSTSTASRLSKVPRNSNF